MFFYRSWICENLDGQLCDLNRNEDEDLRQFQSHSWGYAVLFLSTLLVGVGLNGVVLGSFIFDWKNLKKMPHLGVFVMCIRDLLVALILIPICVHW